MASDGRLKRGQRNDGGSTNATGTSRVQKNAARLKKDISWKHGISVNGDSKKIKCKYCEKVFTGGVYRFKHHLAGTKKNVGPCLAVPDDVKKQMWDIVSELQENLIQRVVTTGCEGGGAKKKMPETPANLYLLSCASTQSLREEANMGVASFLYSNGIPFDVVETDEFKSMCQSIARHGPGYKPPSYDEVRVKYLQQKAQMTQKKLP